MNVYEPEPHDVLEWVGSAVARWPASDWDYYVMNGKNDELVLSLANSDTPVKGGFFLHCLYYLVGDFVISGRGDVRREQRIRALIDRVDERACADVKRWCTQTQAVLEGAPIDPIRWIDFGIDGVVSDRLEAR